MPQTAEAADTRPRYMRLDEVARELGFKSRRPVYDLIATGELEAPPIGPGGSLRVAREEFDRYCQAANDKARAEAERRRRARVAGVLS